MASTPRSGRPHAPRRTTHTTQGSSSPQPRRATLAARTTSSTSASARTRRARGTTGPRQQLGHEGRGRYAQTQKSSRTNTTGDAAANAAPGQGQSRLRNAGRTFAVGGLEVSTRLLAITLLVAVLGVLLVPNVYAWWRQEQDLRDITARVQAAEERNKQMEEELALWQDPDYIASQARERLGYVRPGEVQYTVVDPGQDYQDKAQIAAAQVAGPARPWVHMVVLLLQEADSPSPTSQIAEVPQGEDPSSVAGVGEGAAQSGD